MIDVIEIFARNRPWTAPRGSWHIGELLVVGQVGAHVAVPAAAGDGDLFELGLMPRGVGVQMTSR